MVNTNLALGVLQLVALALSAFAILMEIIVESEFAYANRAVPVIAGSYGLLALGGTIVLTALLLSPLGVIMQVALVAIDLGLVGMVVGIGLVGLRTRQAQAAAAE